MTDTTTTAPATGYVSPEEYFATLGTGPGAAAEFPAFATRPAGRPEAASWSREKIIALQRRLQRAGVLAPPYRLGVFDTQTSQAYNAAIVEANQMQVGLDQALARMESADIAQPAPVLPARQPFPGVGEFKPRSPEELAQDLKTLWRQQLGRDPDADELARFSRMLTGMEAEAFDVNAVAAESDWDRQQAEAASAATGTPVWANMPATAEGDDDDPDEMTAEEITARFAERFEREYKPELNRASRQEDLAENRGSLLQSLLGMDSAIARGA